MRVPDVEGAGDLFVRYHPQEPEHRRRRGKRPDAQRIEEVGDRAQHDRFRVRSRMASNSGPQKNEAEGGYRHQERNHQGNQHRRPLRAM